MEFDPNDEGVLITVMASLAPRVSSVSHASAMDTGQSTVQMERWEYKEVPSFEVNGEFSKVLC